MLAPRFLRSLAHLVLSVSLLLCLLWHLVTPAHGKEISPPAASQARPVLTPQIGHSDPVDFASFSPDGRLIVTASWDGTAKVWDAATGALIRSIIGNIQSAAFSSNGKLIVTASADKTAKVWGTTTGVLIRTLTGHTDGVNSAAFSPDGKHIVTASSDKTAKVWDTATGALVCTLSGHSNNVCSAAFSPDGELIVTASGSLLNKEDNTAKVWNATTGTLIRTLAGHDRVVTTAAFSPNGKQIVTASYDMTAKVWDAATGTLIRTLKGHGGVVFSAFFSPNSKQIVTANFDNTAKVWDTVTGTLTRTLEGHSFDVRFAAFSPNSKQIVTTSIDKTAKVWDATTGTLIRTLTGHSAVVISAFFSPNGKQIVTANFDNTAKVWDTATGTLIRTLEGHSGPVFSAFFSPDGRQIVTTSFDTAKVWNAATGTLIRTLEGHSATAHSVASGAPTSGDEGNPLNEHSDVVVVHSASFSPDGKLIVTASGDHTAKIWDVATGVLIRTFVGHSNDVLSAAFSSNGKLIVTASADKTAKVWGTTTGVLIRTLTGHTDGVNSAAFSPDGKHIVTASSDKTAKVWDTATGALLHTFIGHTLDVNSASFFLDSSQIVTASGDGAVKTWDAATGNPIRAITVNRHNEVVFSATFSPDGRHIATASYDNTAKVCDAATGQELCSLISFDDGTWAITDPEGRYDGSNGGDVPNLHWVIGNTPIALSQLKSRYYDPGLLAKVMGFSKEPLRDVTQFTSSNLSPEISAATPQPGRASLVVNLTNKGGGMGNVELFVNGKRVADDVRPKDAKGTATIAPNAPSARLTVDLAPYLPLMQPGKRNAVEVRAYDAGGLIESRGELVNYIPPVVAPARPPTLHALIVGISHYRGGALDLHFAAKDAADFARALTLSAQGDALPLDLTLLVSPPTGETMPSGGRVATRENVLAAFDALKAKSAPGDILLVYLSGHGVQYGDADKGDYYYLTETAAGSDLHDADARRADTVSGEEIARRMVTIPAGKQLLILDTCASGGFIQKLAEGKEVTGSMRVSWERMHDRAGLFLLAGCAGDQVSYEATRFGQGLLTYSLLEAMKSGTSLRAGEYVDVSPLCQAAVDRVKGLAAQIGGVQQPIFRAKQDANSFDLGRLPSDLRAQVPLALLRPVLVRPTFQETDHPRDPLQLTASLTAALREADATRGDAGSGAGNAATPFVFWDVDDAPDTYSLGGRYTRAADGSVTVTIELYQGDRTVLTFPVAGRADTPAERAALTVALLAAARAHLATLPATAVSAAPPAPTH